MEWVEFTASSLEDATQLAVDGLGLEEAALEIEVLETPVAGLFGRVRGTARIRARAAGAAKAAKGTKAAAKSASKSQSKSQAAKFDASEASGAEAEAPPRAASRATRPKASGPALAAVASVAAAPVKLSRDRRPPASRGSSGPARPSGGPSRMADEPVDVDVVVESSKRFLSGLLEAAGLKGKISHRVVDEQTVEIALIGDTLGMLVGPKGQTLLAAQELLRTFVHHDTGGRSGRLMLDVAGYREKRRAALQIFTTQVAESVVSTGERRVLEPMNAVDRKVVHDTVAGIAGVSSLSEGEDPQRYVVLLPE